VRARYVVITSAAAIALAGCSSGGSSSASGSNATLQADVLQLTQAAAARNWPAADVAMGQLRSDLATALSSGAIGPTQAAKIRADLTAVAADVALKTTPTTPRPTPKPKQKPKPKPQPPKQHGRHGHGGDNQGGDGGD